MSELNKKYSQLHIQLLEPRIMFDGAAIYTASEAIDLLDEQQSSQTKSDPSQIILDVTSITDNPESRKEIVFIDSGVDDYQTIVDAIDSSKSISNRLQRKWFYKNAIYLAKSARCRCCSYNRHASAGL